MKWITAADLNTWSDKDSQVMLPELIYKLICASTNVIEKLRFPKGDSTYLPGWDGVLISPEKIHLGIEGTSLWEIGTSKDVKQKADDDYEKRKINSLGYVPNESTFVFVTSRIWGGVEAWVKEKRTEAHWKDVVVITAVELEDWLEKCPSVAIWLAERFGKTTPSGFYAANSWWMKWAQGKDVILNHNILLGGREQEINTIENALKEHSSCIVQSISTEESLSFIVAALLDKDIRLADRSIVVCNEQALERIIDQYENLIIITDIDNKNYNYASEKHHTIFYAANAEEVFQASNVVELPQVDRELFIKSLVESGLSEEHARVLSKETTRSISILRRKLGIDSNMPEWAKSNNIRELIPAILIGRWTENSSGDKEIVSLISGQSYDEYSKILIKWLKSDDSPLIFIDGTWRITSIYEAYYYALDYISSNDFELYKQAFELIVNDIAPDALERWQAKSIYFNSDKRKYSSRIKDGILQCAILTSLLKESSPKSGFQTGEDWIESLVCATLKDSTIEWWLSYEHQITSIAEASPKSFLTYVTQNIKEKDSIIKRLFCVDDNINLTFSRVAYTNVLWALESTMWNNESLLPVTLILMELSALKNNSNMSNRPINTLVETYKVWHPQTFADIDIRNQVLATAVKRNAKIGFDLCLKLVDNNNSTAHNSNKMRWRNFGQYRGLAISNYEVNKAIDNAVDLLIHCCNGIETQICKLIDVSTQLSQSNRDKILDYINSRFKQIKHSVKVSDSLRELLCHHKSYPKAQWSLPDDELSKYETLLSNIDLVGFDKHLWLFKDPHIDVYYPDISNKDFNECWRRNTELRKNSLLEIYRDGGVGSIINFSKDAGSPSTIGEIFAQICKEGDFEAILYAITIENISEELAKYFFSQYPRVFGVPTFICEVDKLKDKYADYIYLPMAYVFINDEILAYVDTLSEHIQNQYWRNVRVGYHANDTDLNSRIIKKFNSVDRHQDSLKIIYFEIQELKSTQPQELVINTVRNHIINSTHYNGSVIHMLREVVLYLDRLEDVKTADIIYIELLLHSIFSNSDNTRLRRSILSDPKTMMELITYAYLPKDENQRELILSEREENLNLKNLSIISTQILCNLKGTPSVDNDYVISEKELNQYIDELIEFGINADRENVTKSTVGKLLANYPEIGDYPPEAICNIIERYNDSKINEGFYAGVFNKRGVTTRGCFDGGTLEREEAAKYKGFANKVRYTYPLISDIFDSISSDYMRQAFDIDNRDKIEAIEY